MFRCCAGVPLIGNDPEAWIIAVAPGEKDSARATAAETLADARPGACTVLVRVNAPGTPWHDDVRDVADLVAAGHADGAVLPKYEDPDQPSSLRATLSDGARVVGGLESGLGVADARESLAAGPDAAYFGAEDYVADIGGRRSSAGTEVLYARSRVCLHAALAGGAALDQVVTAVRDADAFRADAEQGGSLGFRGKVCLHPAQVGLDRRRVGRILGRFKILD